MVKTKLPKDNDSELAELSSLFNLFPTPMFLNSLIYKHFIHTKSHTHCTIRICLLISQNFSIVHMESYGSIFLSLQVLFIEHYPFECLMLQ